jgi:predicted MFS family arabinose efflux permease
MRSAHHALWVAAALSLGAAVSLGVTRFSYGLLLPAMRADLQWTYTLAGAMNTANAVGYFVGAVATPWLTRRWSPSQLLVWGAWAASVLMGLGGLFVDAGTLLCQRLLAGVASAVVFIAGGLLAAQWGAREPQRGGLLLGMYYSGTGLGIVLCAALVPWLLELTQAQNHGWRWAWWVLALCCALASALLRWPAQAAAQSHAAVQHATAAGRLAFEWRKFAFSLAGYGMFGVGYIGYMTFVVAHLRAQGSSTLMVAVFYGLLGLAVVLSSRVWAGLLDRQKGGGALATLNALLAIATVLPALSSHPAVVLLSGVMFGGVFLSVVASTTALVRHNVEQAGWAAGISAFTIVFAAGQIVGPTVVGWIADGPGGLSQGLLFSSAALWVGAALAWRQRAL